MQKDQAGAAQVAVGGGGMTSRADDESDYAGRGVQAVSAR
jgi:hypothetical protein